ncbi:hypothetical protein M3204_17215 [Mesobacillus subterraneus]|uniref:hypothetical protein n=1 Tax=Mesobacillus subterraneus TaxID=285983 RepID=UPI00203E0036|nr:hypothetical protein [Mesobacillus subterraneus]MCM3666161.1 hypothetical protein [Mesobacillus subterraneus]MCM3685159.1 hypothetical protein [Mesobacillus subterraneus]
MVRIHNPVDGDKKKAGSDGQLHGGTLENADQLFDSIFKPGDKGEADTKSNKQK